jgi:hypothetical protein
MARLSASKPRNVGEPAGNADTAAALGYVMLCCVAHLGFSRVGAQEGDPASFSAAPDPFFICLGGQTQAARPSR